MKKGMIVVLLGMMVMTANAGAGNLLVNGGFETSPTTWYVDAAGGASRATSVPMPQEGSYDLKLFQPNALAQAVNPSLLVPNTTYILTAWVNFSQDFSGTIQYGIQDWTWSGMNHYIGANDVGKDQWIKLQSTFTTGATVPGAFEAHFDFFGASTTGYVAFDNISVDTNILANGDFETNPADWYIDAAGGVEWVTGTPAPVTGTYCFKMFGPNVLAKSVNTSLLRPNTTYDLTACVYFSSDFVGTMQYGIQIQDWSWSGMNHYLGSDDAPKDQWFVIQSTFTTGDVVPTMFEPQFYFYGASSTGFVAFDTISVVPEGTMPLTVTPQARSVGVEAGQVSFFVFPGTLSTAWSAAVIDGADWLTVTGAGTGAGMVRVSYTANPVPSDYPRIGHIRITDATGSQDITITQAAVAPVIDLPAASGTMSVDGVLNEWTDATWIAMDKNYYRNATDIAQAFYAAKWNPSNNKIYVAVKMEDTAHKFTSDYTGWASRDAIEIYIHTTATGNINYHANEDTAQQWVVGIKSGTTDQVWMSLTDRNNLPAGSGFLAAGMVDGAWIYYEAEVTPFEYFGGVIGGTNIITTLAADQQIGLDICAVSNDGSGVVGPDGVMGFTGMKCENLLSGKSDNWTQFRRHKLVGGSAPRVPGDANGDHRVDVSDLGILAANYGGTGKTWALGDFSGDGKVDVSDLGILAANYGKGTGAVLDFKADAKALGLAVEDVQAAEKDDAPVSSALGCGSAGLPLLAGVLLAGLLLSGLKLRVEG